MTRVLSDRRILAFNSANDRYGIYQLDDGTWCLLYPGRQWLSERFDTWAEAADRFRQLITSDLGHQWEQIAPGARRCSRCRLRDADPMAMSRPCSGIPWATGEDLMEWVRGVTAWNRVSR